ncbi:protein DBF4 homolog A [Parambassis ranga]|uniref:Protein DBF4 homolog A n=1 Tax=Parambassis ranga TaxID=210632 RepID=A0A6P7JX39_9TELE|nr:protein DBF4 homolog A [Parambassis ranga]
MKENKMKPKRTQKHAEHNWQGKGGNTGKTLSHAKHTSVVSSPAQVRPFAGKVFYLDLPSNRRAETLESDIKELGGTVEKFFSKEIKYLVSNKREARYVRCLRQDSPVPSPDSGQSSPHPPPNPHRSGTHGDKMKNRSQGHADTFASSRGKSLVERVVQKQERVQMNKILSNALEWGVKILYIDDVMAYVQRKKKVISSHKPVTTAVKTSVKAESATKQGLQKCKGGRISKPFIKVEDSSRHYRPIYLNMLNMPEFNLKTVAPGSPFCIEDKAPLGNKQRGHRGAKASASEERAHGWKKNRDKKRGGYCECCTVRYDNLTMHLQSECHKAFSKSDAYLVVDRLISTLPCNFIPIKTKAKRTKCSVSSVLVASGQCRKIDISHKGDPDHSEPVKEEHHQTLDGHNELYTEDIIKIRSPDCSPLCRKRNCYSYSDRFKHRRPARKRMCRQNFLTSCTQRTEEDHIAPSRNECLPSRDIPDDPVDQKPHQHLSCSNSHIHNMNMQNEASQKRISVMTNEQEKSDKNEDTSLCKALHDRHVFTATVTEGNLSEKEEQCIPTPSFSPVRKKIQRRVKFYKHKRRKVDTRLEDIKPCEGPGNSILKLWELFQSSENMDVEFHGFED